MILFDSVQCIGSHQLSLVFVSLSLDGLLVLVGSEVDMETMTPDYLEHQERLNTGTSWTNNEQFDKDGYIVVKNLWDANELFVEVPTERGTFNYWGTKEDQFTHTPLENQVEGSFACYTGPQYRVDPLWD